MTPRRSASIMPYGLGILCVLAALSGCAAYHQAKNLSPDEQAEFRMYRKVMNAPQIRAYLAQANAAERTAYLEQLGLAQRFNALDSQDQDAVEAGFIRKGMSADALRFLWGRPSRTSGYTGHYEHWYYYGPLPSLVDTGSRRQDAGTRVDVYLVDNRVKWWLESVTPNMDDDSDDGGDSFPG
jgi:outer membrane protein assembly factor BamE (lipoprotein component of BamABCDE complex)